MSSQLAFEPDNRFHRPHSFCALNPTLQPPDLASDQKLDHINKSLFYIAQFCYRSTTAAFSIRPKFIYHLVTLSSDSLQMYPIITCGFLDQVYPSNCHTKYHHSVLCVFSRSQPSTLCLVQTPASVDIRGHTIE